MSERRQSGRSRPGDDAGLAGYFREAWSEALVRVNDASEEVSRLVTRFRLITLETMPGEERRLVAELAEKLRRQRDELTSTVESAVRRALASFHLPAREEVAALEKRLRGLEERLDRLAARRAGR